MASHEDPIIDSDDDSSEGEVDLQEGSSEFTTREIKMLRYIMAFLAVQYPSFKHLADNYKNFKEGRFKDIIIPSEVEVSQYRENVLKNHKKRTMKQLTAVIYGFRFVE
jgi:hypothetical protein